MFSSAPGLAWSDFVLELSSLLRQRDLRGPLYLVGGAVRDAWLGGAIKDIDIAVAGDALGLARRVANWLEADFYVMDRERGVARVLLGAGAERISVDFARLRGESLEEDLRDRDFTMNAMAVDLLGGLDKLIDPLGGAADLRQGVLRRCSADAMSNDPIRALRAVRLSAQFSLKIHPDTAADIRAHAGGLSQCSGERIRDELFKVLALDKAARALRVMLHLGLLRQVLPIAALADADWAQSLPVVERMTAILNAISSRRSDNTAAAFDLGMLVIQLDRFRASLQAHIEREYGAARSHGDLLTLAALLLGRGEMDLAALKLSADEERSLRQVSARIGSFSATASSSPLEQHRFWRELKAGGIDVILLSLANYLARQGRALEQKAWLRQVESATLLLDAWFNRYNEIVAPAMLLNGNEIRQQLQLKAGPLVGELLRALREAQVTGEVSSKREARRFVARQLESNQ